MKKVLYLLASALFMLGATSCEKKTVSSDGQSEEQAGKVKVTFAASSQQSGKKTSLSATDQVLWSADDEVTIYAGDEEEVFTIASGVGTTSGTFEGWATTSFTAPYYAIYPSSAAQGIEDDNLLFSIPESQTYTANSFGNSSAVMAAYSEKDKSLAFKNLVGIIDLKLTGEGTVTFLRLTSGSNAICGDFSVSKDDPTAPIEAIDGAERITLDGVSAITLSSTATHVYIAVAPTDFEADDLTLDMKSSDNKSFTTTIGGFTTSRASIKEVDVAVVFVEPCGETVPSSSTSVSDVCGNTYNTVKIGNQIWMAENLRCNQYSANSDAEASIKSNPIGTSESPVTTPYYTDGTASGYGYYYNWAAAVGLADGMSQTTDFPDDRQGICPDGWHVPTDAEIDALVDYIEVTEGKGEDKAGKYLKEMTGWTSEGGIDNLNCYGFAGLASGYAEGSEVVGINEFSLFWTASPIRDDDIDGAHLWALEAFNDALIGGDTYKQFGHSVRCVKIAE